jgi:glycosyltransferase involved in cell wall biosynthesis
LLVGGREHGPAVSVNNMTPGDTEAHRVALIRPTRIGFVLTSHSQSPLPSTRIAVLNMFPFLRAAGFELEIMYEPEPPALRPRVDGLEQRIAAAGIDIAFLQKVHGPSVERLARRLAERGIATVFSICDVVVPSLVEHTDTTVAVTEHLRSLYPPALRPKIHVVHDGIENRHARKLDYGAPRGRGEPLRAVLVTSSPLSTLPVLGNPPDWLNVTVVGPFSPVDTALRRLRDVGRLWLEPGASRRLERLRFLMSRRIHRVPWHPQGVYDVMQAADVGIIPVDDSAPAWQLKSENRLTLKMSMGLPVVAAPVPSYTPVIKQGVNGFIAATRAQWLEYLDALRDPALRQQVGERAREAVVERYSKREQARRLISVLRSLHVNELHARYRA